MSDAAELARRIAEVHAEVRAVSRASQISRSTLNVEGTTTLIPDALAAGAETAVAVEDLQSDLDDTRADIEDGSGELADQIRDELDDLTQIPAAPTGLVIVSNVGTWREDRSAGAIVTLAWDEVVEDIEGTPLQVSGYDVSSDVDATSAIDGQTDTEEFTAEVWTPGKERAVRVRARVGFTVGDWSDPIMVSPAFPDVLNVTPSSPVLTPGMGGVAFRWDGLTSAGTTMPLGIARVVVDAGPSAAGPWSALGAPLSAAGGGTISAPAGQLVAVRFRAFDTLGRPAGTSAVATATAEGVSLGDIPGLEGELDDIRFTADGKNRIYVSTGEPVGDGKNLCPDPSFEGAITAWSFSGSTTGAPSTEWAHVGSRSMKVTSGSTSPSSGDIRFGSLTSFPPGIGPGSTVTVSAFLNTPAAHAGLNTTASSRQRRMLAFIGMPGGGVTQTFGPQAPNVAGVHRVSHTFTIPSTATGLVIAVGCAGSASDAAFVSYVDAVQVELGATLTPFTQRFIQGDLWLQLDTAGASVSAVKVWSGTAWAPQVLLADSIVAAGSITGALIKAGELQVAHVSPSFGDDLPITANGSIVLALGNAANASAEAELANDRVTGVATTVTYAQEQAAAAAANAAQAITAAENLGRYYRFSESDLRIGRPGQSAELSIAETGIAFLQNDVPVSLWDGGQMIVSRFVGEEVVLANHKIETRGARTIVRSM